MAEAQVAPPSSSRLHRLAARVRALAGWRRSLAAAALGVLAAFALPPYHALPVLFVAFTGLAWMLEGAAQSGSRGAAFRIGWWFGVGHHLLGLYWISNALLTDVARFGWMVPFAVFGLPAFFALFVGAATYTVALFKLRGLRRVLALALAWTAAEWLRGHILTGFPWNLMGYAWTALPEMLQLAALLGIYGLSLLTVAVALLPALAGEAERTGWARWRPLGAGLALVALIAAGGAARIALTEVTTVPGLILRLVQANIPQSVKWLPAQRTAVLERHLAMSIRRPDGATPLIIWPETAVPYLLEETRDARAQIGDVVRLSGLVLTGVARITDRDKPQARLWNSVAALDGDGRIIATYDKFHLVPFGEYLPLRSLLGQFGIDKMVYGPFDFSAGPGPRTLHLPGFPPVGPLVCYEAIFPGRVVDAADRPEWLLNVSNDGWYGYSTGPFQHFAMARVRSVEEGLPLVRAANTGISGVIDPLGRVVGQLDLQRSGVLEAALSRPLPPPPYARYGDGLLAIVALALLGIVIRRV